MKRLAKWLGIGLGAFVALVIVVGVFAPEETAGPDIGPTLTTPVGLGITRRSFVEDVTARLKKREPPISFSCERGLSREQVNRNRERMAMEPLSPDEPIVSYKCEANDDGPLYGWFSVSGPDQDITEVEAYWVVASPVFAPKAYQQGLYLARTVFYAAFPLGIPNEDARDWFVDSLNQIYEADIREVNGVFGDRSVRILGVPIENQTDFISLSISRENDARTTSKERQVAATVAASAEESVKNNGSSPLPTVSRTPTPDFYAERGLPDPHSPGLLTPVEAGTPLSRARFTLLRIPHDSPSSAADDEPSARFVSVVLRIESLAEGEGKSGSPPFDSFRMEFLPVGRDQLDHFEGYLYLSVSGSNRAVSLTGVGPLFSTWFPDRENQGIVLGPDDPLMLGAGINGLLLMQFRISKAVVIQDMVLFVGREQLFAFSELST